MECFVYFLTPSKTVSRKFLDEINSKVFDWWNAKKIVWDQPID